MCRDVGVDHWLTGQHRAHAHVQQRCSHSSSAAILFCSRIHSSVVSVAQLAQNDAESLWRNEVIFAEILKVQLQQLQGGLLQWRLRVASARPKHIDAELAHTSGQTANTKPQSE